jgi:hypothetical protein
MTKQQTTLQTLIAWGDKMIKEHPIKHLSFVEAIDKAEELLEMEEKQINQSYMAGLIDGMNQQPKGYYKETYKQ